MCQIVSKTLQENQKKISSSDYKESDFLDHEILKLNKNFRSNLYLIKAMVREKNFDLGELTNFRLEFVLP